LGGTFDRSPVSFQSRAVGVGQATVPSACLKSLRASTDSDVIVLRSPPGILRFIAICASGVLPSSRATGVGNEPNPISPVRGAKGTSRYAVPLRVIPERGQVSKHSPESSSKESWDVLHQDVSGSKLANKAGVLRPKTRTLSLNTCASSCVAEVLARESTAENVDRLNVIAPQLAYVVVDRHVRPVLGKNLLAEGVLLAEPCGLKASPFQPKVEAANAREQAADLHAASRSALLAASTPAALLGSVNGMAAMSTRALR
jgi:hypothetical protein